LIRQLLTESVLLALSGGAAGCLLAVWLTNLLGSFHPPTPVPFELNPTLDGRVLGFTLAVSVLSGVLLRLAPAWHASKLDLFPMLKDDRRTGGRRTTQFSMRNLLVISQVAVSLVLLICAGLFTRSLQHAHNIDPGFETERVLTVPLDLEPVGYNEARGGLFYRQLLDQVERVPGVQSASLAEIIPLTLSRSHGRVAVEGYEAPDGNYPDVDNNIVGPRYFETMGIPVVAGREFTPQDASAPRVVVVNETMARRFWPRQSPLGRRLRSVSLQDNSSFSPYFEVVGIVKDIKSGTLGEEPKSFLYLPTLQSHQMQMVRPGSVFRLRRRSDPLCRKR
jgi:putative ABC transport system permease protein